MGHAHHFLSRLDRVSLPHVELALGLYNDAPLLTYILRSVRLPEGAERVAISLDDPVRGPFLVVTREGRFVTCLGEGMVTGDLPVVPRAQLDALAAKVEVLRRRLEDAKRLSGRVGGVGKLLARIHEAGDELSREEVSAIIGLQPLYATEFFYFYYDAIADLSNARDILARELKHTDKLKGNYRDGLRSYWNTLWSIGHLAVLSSANGPALFERWPEALRRQILRSSISWGAVEHGLSSVALRGIWAVARVGKVLLPALKKDLREADSKIIAIDSCMGLAAIGLRHTRLRAEVLKTLGAEPEHATPTANLVHAVAKLMRAVIDPEICPPEAIANAHRAWGRRVWMLLTQHLPLGSPHRFARDEDVPDEIALPAAVHAATDFTNDNQLLGLLFQSLPWVARASAEDLYLPRDLLNAIHLPWHPELTLMLVRSYRDYYKAPPQKKAAGPARKGPCPCGSGKKYKRCCEAKGEAKVDEAAGEARVDEATEDEAAE